MLRKVSGEALTSIPPFFKVLVNGQFASSDIRVRLTEGTLARSNESEAYISSRWGQYEGEKWPSDVQPSRFRFVSSEVQNNRLTITLDPCVSYRDCIGTRGREFTRIFGPAFFPNPLSVDSLVVTSDGKILLTKRGDKADYKPGGLHASFGGWVELADVSPDGSVNLSKAVLREIREESGIQPNEVRKINCIGVLDSYDGTGSGISFISHLAVPLIEVINRQHDHENMLFALPGDRITIKDLILNYAYALVPSALAQLLKYGLDTFEPGWYEDVRSKLHYRGKDINSESAYREKERLDIEFLRENVNHQV